MWIVTKADELYHIGMPRRSGRYPFGSGKRPFQGLENKLQKRRQARLEQKKRYQEEKQKKYQYNEMKKTARTMSDDDIRNKIARLKMERELKQLIDENTHPKRKAFADAVGRIGGQAIQRAGSDVATKTLYWAIGNAINSADGKSYEEMPSLSEYLFGKTSATNKNSMKDIEQNVKSVLSSLGVDNKRSSKIVQEALNTAKLDKVLNNAGMEKEQRKKLIEDIFDRSSDSISSDSIINTLTGVLDSNNIDPSIRDKKIKELKVSSELYKALDEFNVSKEQRKKFVDDIVKSLSDDD